MPDPAHREDGQTNCKSIASANGVAGDPRYPYVIGSLWNGKDAPPQSMDAQGNNNLKVLRSRNGLKITLDDTDGVESMTLETPALKGRYLGLSGRGRGCGVVGWGSSTDPGSPSIPLGLEDSQKLTPERETPGDQKVTLKDSPSSVQINDSNGNSIKMDATGITSSTNVRVIAPGGFIAPGPPA